MRRHFAWLLALLLPACSASQDALDPPVAAQVGSLEVSISGLPSGATATVSVTGPGGYARQLAATSTLDTLVPGSYTVTAGPVTVDSLTYDPVPVTQTVEVAAGGPRASAAVVYGNEVGRLALLVTGLPPGVAASVAVAGPGDLSRTLATSDTLDALVPGTYTVSASEVTSGGTSYQPAPASQQASVTASALASAGVVYTAVAPPSLDLSIDGMYVVQSVQSYGDTIPLVAGRDAVVRVFVKANAVNAAAPAVRLRLYQGAGATPVQTWTIAAARPFVPTTIREDSLAWSWNQLVPGTLLQPGARLLADVDPAGGVAETDETNNAFPASGAPMALDVRTVNPFTIRFVPVRMLGNGAVGNVNTANRAQFLVTFAKAYPVLTINADVRSAIYTTTTVDTLQSNNGNGAWGAVLSEISALRSADGFPGYYFGVVRAGYGSGTAGIGYVPGRAAVGWDRLPSGDGVAAHELGHNMSLSHAPCGGASASDPNYPYAGGVTRIYGLDVLAMAVKSPSLTDLMGYCNGNWISDYHYLKVLNYRQANAAALVLSQPRQPALLIWGRIADGVVTLEPAFEIAAPARLPAGRGRFALEALDANGRVVYGAAFDGDLVADQDREERHFAFVVPLARLGAYARLQVRDGLGAAVRESPAALRAGAAAGDRVAVLHELPSPTLSAARESDRVRLRWDARSYPMALVRDGASGDILSFARGGEATVVGAASTLDVTFSDGVRSRRETAAVR